MTQQQGRAAMVYVIMEKVPGLSVSKLSNMRVHLSFS